MHAPDLATECQIASGPAVRAIGWLAKGQSFARGSVDPRFLAALRAHASDPGRWVPVASGGLHVCDLGGCARASGGDCVIIPSATCVYVAPDLVEHYVDKHQYAPPPEFVSAVLACPEQASDAYVELLLPFADTWSLDAKRVRDVASLAQRIRRDAQADASKSGGFTW